MNSILKADPYPWKDQDAQQLHMTLVKLYPSCSEAKYAAQLAGIQEWEVNFEQAPKYVWVDILKVAANSGLTEGLVQTVYERQKPTSPSRPLLEALLTGSEALPDTKPDKTDDASLESIQREVQLDTEPDKIDSASLESIQSELFRLQRETLYAFASADIIEIDGKLEETEELLKDGLKQWPGNLLLLNLRGYYHKNVAMEYQRLSMSDSANEHLESAEKIFRMILTQDQYDANAWNGLGSVYWLGQELDQAEMCMRKALTIYPNHNAAQQDLANLLKYRERTGR